MLYSNQVSPPIGTHALLTCPMPFHKTYALPVTLLNKSSLDFCILFKTPFLQFLASPTSTLAAPSQWLQVSGQQGQCPWLSTKREWSCSLLAVELTTSIFPSPSLYPHHSNPWSHRKTDHDKWREQEHQHQFKPQLCSYCCEVGQLTPLSFSAPFCKVRIIMEFT